MFRCGQLKHVPVHLRKRSLHEQTEKASRILAEEMEGQAGAGEAADDEHGYVSAARGPLLVGTNGRSAESDEQVKLGDILELALELLELVEAHVGRCGTLEDVARFENQLKVLRRGRDSARSQGHVEDKRAIVLAFSIFSEHYTYVASGEPSAVACSALWLPAVQADVRVMTNLCIVTVRCGRAMIVCCDPFSPQADAPRA